MLFLLLLALLLIPSGNLRADSRPLDIYWIDTEGGAATLLVSPTSPAEISSPPLSYATTRRTVDAAPRQHSS
jgi:hypothetical protein